MMGFKVFSGAVAAGGSVKCIAVPGGNDALSNVRIKPGGDVLLYGYKWAPTAVMLGKVPYPALEQVREQVEAGGVHVFQPCLRRVRQSNDGCVGFRLRRGVSAPAIRAPSRATVSRRFAVCVRCRLDVTRTVPSARTRRPSVARIRAFVASSKARLSSRDQMSSTRVSTLFTF